MEIRSSLRKIDNYLKIVADLNKAILEEGTMAPEELQIMKKYLYVCIERIEDIQIKLGLSTLNDTESNVLKAAEPLQNENEVVLKDVNQNLQNENDNLSDEVKGQKETKIDVLNSFVEENIANIPDLDKSTIRDNAIEIEKIVEKTVESILVEPAIFLSADLPSIKYNTAINFSDYEQIIIENVDDEIETAIAHKNLLVAEAIENVDALIAGDVAIEQEKNIFEPIAKEEIKEQVIERNSLVADAVVAEQEKIVFEPIAKEESRKEEKVLVADDEVGEMEKIVFKPITELENKEQEIITTALVKEDEPEDTLFVSFDAKKKKIPENTHINLIDTSNEKVEESQIATNTIFNKPEYESIMNRKSLSESIALNDKFIFVRELFGSQFSEYENSIKEIDVFENHQEALDFCTKALATKYNWDNKKNITDRFLSILAKKYNL